MNHGSPALRRLTMLAITLTTACGDERLSGVPPCQSTEASREVAREELRTRRAPLDVVFLVDNSASMQDEITALQDNINRSFAALLDEAGIDYRIVVVSRHGSVSELAALCISRPLSGTSCNPVPSTPANTERLLHYSFAIGSHDGWCKLLRTYTGGARDDFGLSPGGWRSHLRPDALKAFIQIGDDGVECQYRNDVFDDQDDVLNGKAAAGAFDAALLDLGQGSFGVPEARDYVWYSLTGMAPSALVGGMLDASAPIIAQTAASATGPGTASQALSVLTGGLRFSVGQSGALELAFSSIVEHVIETVTDRELGCR